MYYDDDELFDMFENERNKKILLDLYEEGTLEKFGIENLGYNKYKDRTFDLLEDIISLAYELEYGCYSVFYQCNNMEELKKCKYKMLEEYYEDVSNERYNFPEIVEEIIKVLKENFPDVLIIDSERKKKIEEHYQHCNLTYDEKEKEEAEYGRYHLIIALIVEGIRFTYKIVIYENIAYINMEHCETNIANLWLEEKIENVFKKFFKNKSSKLK